MTEADQDRRDALSLMLGAEGRLAHGVLDADAFGRASARDVTCERCSESDARFEEQDAAAPADTSLRLWLAAAAFLALALLVWPTRTARTLAPRPAAAAPDASADATMPG